ncbi:MAG: surface lipoprotein assembly modifier [Burkholderiales bacterium]
MSAPSELTQPGIDVRPRRANATAKKRVFSTRPRPSIGSKKFMTNSSSVKRTLLALGFCLWVTGNSALAAGLDLEKAEALMKQGKAAEAYSLLEPFEFEQSGNIKFDYLLGIAALDSGKPDKATIAFERVLAVDPNFAGARIDMGRAYFQLGDLTRAKLEFEAVLTQNPPPAAKATINNYLAAIEKQESAKKTKGTGYFEASIGHDTNVNFATSQSQIAVPALGNLIFTLNPAGVKAPDDYLGYAFGGEISHQIAPALGVYAGADARSRSNMTQDQFDSTSLDLRAGLAMGEGASVLRLGVLGGRYALDGKTNRDTNGVNAEWRHLLNPANQLSLFGQYARFRFEPTISVNDFDQSTYGANWLHLANEGKALVMGSLFTGDERAPLRADGGKRYTGLRLGGQLQLSEKTELFGGLGAQFSKYQLANAAFSSPAESVTRDDKQYDANVGLNWHFDKAWTLRPQISYMRNDSNIVIYEFDRTDISITIRRDFK